MAKFTIKFLFVMCILLVGILLGIHQAEHGILSIQNLAEGKGNEQGEQDEQVSSAEPQQNPTFAQLGDTHSPLIIRHGEFEYYITRIDGQEVEIARVDEISEGEKDRGQFEVVPAQRHHNRYAQTGDALGNIVYTVSAKGVGWLVNLLDRIL